MAKNNNVLNKEYHDIIYQSVKGYFLQRSEEEIRWIEIMEAVISDAKVLAVLEKKQKAQKESKEHVESFQNGFQTKEERRKYLINKLEYMVNKVLKEMSDKGKMDRDIKVSGTKKNKRYSLIKRTAVVSMINNGPIELLSVVGVDIAQVAKRLEEIGQQEDRNFIVISVNDRYLMCTIKNTTEEKQLDIQYLKSIVERTIAKSRMSKAELKNNSNMI